MTKFQWTIVGIFALLFCVLYFGFPIKSTSQKTTETSRATQGEVTGFETLLEDAKEHLSAEQTVALTGLDQQLEQANTDADKSTALKALSGFWYKSGNIPVAGCYAEQVADIENTDAAWSVTGGTFYNGLVAAKEDQTIRTFCAGRAIKAFEKAVSLAPSKIEYSVNIALIYAENPPPDNPMKAVLQLRELEAKHPEEPSVYNALGRLAIKTGQWERAIDRLTKAYSLDKNNPNTPCLLAKAYEGAGNPVKASEFAQLCNSATGNQ